MFILFFSFLSSWIVTLFILRSNHLHGRWSADNDLAGVQKFHARPTPRVGGIGIFLGLLVAILIWSGNSGASLQYKWLLLLSSLPAFLGGVIEDITKKVGVLQRLFLTMLSAALGFVLLGAGLQDADLPLLDYFLAWLPFSFVFTCFAVAGVANSINLIDGYNGLAGMVCIFAFVALAYVGYAVGDTLIWVPALAMVGGILGFFVWNYPKGLIFLGDGGAYFSGFMIAELSVLLLVRNPQVSSWFPLLVVFYPVFETIFTIYRRVVVRRTSPGLPDAVHLHQMIYMRLVRWAVGSRCADAKTMRNSMTAPYLWVLSSIAVIPAMMFWDNQIMLQFFLGIFIAVYLCLYRAIAKFKAPKFLVVKFRFLSCFGADKKD